MNMHAVSIAGIMLLLSAPTFADAAETTLIIRNHCFTPSAITVPAGERVKLTIDNQDPTPEEFESHDLNREKIIPAHSQVTIWIGPLKQGSYAFVGEYHEDTAKGRILAR